MSRRLTVQECDQEVSTLFDHLSRPLQKALATLVCGVVFTQRATLAKASAATPGPALNQSKTKRSQRLLANPHLQVGRVQRRLIQRVLANRQGRIALLLDATTTGATAHQPGTMTLMLALAWHHRAIPLWWHSWETTKKGQHWRRAIKAMVTTVDALLPQDTEVLLLADRQFPGRPLLRLLQEHHWHYLLRVRRTFLVQSPDGRCPIGDLVPTSGRQRFLRDVTVASTVTNVVAVWPRHSPESWLLVTDLTPTRKRCLEYRRRTWEEELFRDLKSMGWGWDRSRVRQPKRVERLLVVLAVATLWMMALAQQVITTGQRRLLEPTPGRFSRFRLGCAFLHRLMANDDPVPCLLTLPSPWHAT
jgi:Transposase DDE domain